jgi:hypothetical protein
MIEIITCEKRWNNQEDDIGEDRRLMIAWNYKFRGWGVRRRLTLCSF